MDDAQRMAAIEAAINSSPLWGIPVAERSRWLCAEDRLQVPDEWADEVYKIKEAVFRDCEQERIARAEKRYDGRATFHPESGEVSLRIAVVLNRSIAGFDPERDGGTAIYLHYFRYLLRRALQKPGNMPTGGSETTFWQLNTLLRYLNAEGIRVEDLTAEEIGKIARLTRLSEKQIRRALQYYRASIPESLYTKDEEGEAMEREDLYYGLWTQGQDGGDATGVPDGSDGLNEVARRIVALLEGSAIVRTPRDGFFFSVFFGLWIANAITATRLSIGQGGDNPVVLSLRKQERECLRAMNRAFVERIYRLVDHALRQYRLQEMDEQSPGQPFQDAMVLEYCHSIGEQITQAAVSQQKGKFMKRLTLEGIRP